MWHHRGDPQGACDELARTLRPGGRAVVIDLEIAAAQKAVQGLDGHDRAFGPDDMRRILAQSGFDGVHAERFGEWNVGWGDTPGGSHR
jgi:SAM-dependent methyltransferase